jgi:hypothetical protein
MYKTDDKKYSPDVDKSARTTFVKTLSPRSWVFPDMVASMLLTVRYIVANRV